MRQVARAKADISIWTDDLILVVALCGYVRQQGYEQPLERSMVYDASLDDDISHEPLAHGYSGTRESDDRPGAPIQLQGADL